MATQRVQAGGDQTVTTGAFAKAKDEQDETRGREQRE